MDQLLVWVLVAYSILMHGFSGQTLGKMACRVKVYNVEGGPLSMQQAFMRDVVVVIGNALLTIYALTHQETYIEFLAGGEEDLSLIPLWVLFISMMYMLWLSLEVVTMLTNDHRRALHDFIAGSVVKRTA